MIWLQIGVIAQKNKETANEQLREKGVPIRSDSVPASADGCAADLPYYASTSPNGNVKNLCMQADKKVALFVKSDARWWLAES